MKKIKYILALALIGAALLLSSCVGNDSGKTLTSVSSPFENSIIGAWARSDSNGFAGMHFSKAGMVKLVIMPVGEDINSMIGVYRFIDRDRLEIKLSIKEDPGYISRTYKVISISDGILILKDEKEDANIILEKLDIK